MATSSVPLSLLSKGVGQITKNGQERLDVYLEPEDYYNLNSKYQQQIEQFHRQTGLNGDTTKGNVPLHKTFLTRKGALLLFSEELAFKTNDEDDRIVKPTVKENSLDHNFHILDNAEKATEEPILKTCHDLSWAVLNYGRQKPNYRKKGDDLYFRFLFESKEVVGRKIRPGFSPKRYISTWSKQWNEAMLQKLRHNGLISDKTLYRQNPLLPHLYKNATYNLSSVPPPYRVTKNMLVAPGNVPIYEFYRVRGAQGGGSEASLDTVSKVPPPSQQDGPVRGPFPVNQLQAMKYHDSGEIMEVTYSDLKPQEKQEILTELLIAAHEHQKHIRDTLELVMSRTKKQPEESEKGGSSSGASELMMDMQRAILSLVESPVRQQMRERQKLLQEQELKLQEQKRKKKEKEDRRQKRRQKRNAKEDTKQKLPIPTQVDPVTTEVTQQNIARTKQTVVKVKPQVQEEEKEVLPKDEERKEKEERRRKRREERELRRKQREAKVKEEEQKKAVAAAVAAEERQEFKRKPSQDKPMQSPENPEQERLGHHRRHKLKGDHENLQGQLQEKVKKRHRTSERSHHSETIEEHQAKKDMAQHESLFQKPIIMETSISVYDDKSHPQDTKVIIENPHRGNIIGVQHGGKEKRSKITRRDAKYGGEIQVPTNTPAVNSSRVLSQTEPLHDQKIEYEDVYVVKRGSQHSSINDVEGASGSYLINPVNEIVISGPKFERGPKSASSSQSSGPKQILFQPFIPGDDQLPQVQNSSFYGGAMPITSNLVKSTMPDKVSMISGSQRASEAESSSQKTHSASNHSSKYKQRVLSHKKTYQQKEAKMSEIPVPSIGIEPATPIQLSQLRATPRQEALGGTHYLAPSGSLSGSQRDTFVGVRPRSGSIESDDDNGSSKDEDDGKLPPHRDSENDDSNNSDDDTKSSEKSTQRKLSNREFASKSSQTSSSLKSQKASKLLKKESSLHGGSKADSISEVDAPIYGLKGATGPGSQSSSSFLKSTSTKKSRSTRGSLPSAMRKGRSVAASLKMPDGEVVPVGGSLNKSSDREFSDTDYEDTISQATKDYSEHLKSNISSDQSLDKSKLISDQSSTSLPLGSLTQARRVSFAKSVKSKESTFHEQSQQEESSADEKPRSFTHGDVSEDEQYSKVETELEEEDQEESDDEEVSETEDDAWPEVEEDDEVPSNVDATSSKSRPVSSRSSKLTAHAQKVALIVVKKQRPKSGLGEDANEAAAIWNETIKDDEEEESVEEESDFEEEEEVEDSEDTQVKYTTEITSKDEHHNVSDVVDRKRQDKRQEKVIVSSVPAISNKLSVPSGSVKSASSVASSISSVQEEFVNKIQERASNLGIEASDLEFEGDVVEKLEKSDIDPSEVEVVHDKESGVHIVRSRRSSNTVSSVLTSTSDETKKAKNSPRVKAPTSEAKAEKQTVARPTEDQPKPPKHQLVVDLPQSISPSRASSVTTSASSTSSRSPISRDSSVLLDRKRSDIQAEQASIQFDIDVTTYEGKLGDPKVEEPLIQASRPLVEPEKIKTIPDKKNKAATDQSSPGKSKLASIKQTTGTAGSVKSDKLSKQQPKAKGATKNKQATAPTKGPRRKGKVVSNEDDGESVAAMSEHTDDTKTTEKSVRKAEVKSKSQRSKQEGERDATQSSPDKRLNAKTPETPFLAGRPKEKKVPEESRVASTPEEKTESIASLPVSKKGTREKKKKSREISNDTTKSSNKATTETKVSAHVNKEVEIAKSREIKTEISPEPEEIDDESDDLPPLPAETPEDNYDFVRVEETPEVETPKLPTPTPPPDPPEEIKVDDDKSQISEVTDGTEISSQAAVQSAEDAAEREAKLAAKQEREQKRAAAAERRKQEVERKRKEKEDQIRKEKEEQERQEQMKEELDAERRRREEDTRRKKEEAEREKQREKEEEELRKRRLLQQQERERKQQEEYRRKMEELQKKKHQEEERKRQLALEKAKEEEERRKEEQAMLAEMEESERLQYEQRKKEEAEERRIREEERRIREEEEAKVAMERARIQALIKAKQQAALEEKLKFVREFLLEANGLDKTQNVNRPFIYSYFELMQMLGLDVAIE